MLRQAEQNFCEGLTTLETESTERASQAWNVYASTRTLSVSGCTREQETRRLEDTEVSGRSRERGYRQEWFGCAELQWLWDQAMDSHLIDAQLGFFIRRSSAQTLDGKILRNHISAEVCREAAVRKEPIRGE